jgi:hypothetical protein
MGISAGTLMFAIELPPFYSRVSFRNTDLSKGADYAIYDARMSDLRWKSGRANQPEYWTGRLGDGPGARRYG